MTEAGDAWDSRSAIRRDRAPYDARCTNERSSTRMTPDWAPRHLRVLGVGGQSLAVPLVGGEAREIDERESDVGGPGELRRSEVADDLAAAALDGTGHATRVGLEVGELGGVQRVADAQCEHDALLSSGVWPRDARPSTRNASIQPEASGLAGNAPAL